MTAPTVLKGDPPTASARDLPTPRLSNSHRPEEMHLSMIVSPPKSVTPWRWPRRAAALASPSCESIKARSGRQWQALNNFTATAMDGNSASRWVDYGRFYGPVTFYQWFHVVPSMVDPAELTTWQRPAVSCICGNGHTNLVGGFKH